MADKPFFFEYQNNNDDITPLLTQRKSRIESMTHSRVIQQYQFQDWSLAQGKFSYKNVAEVPMSDWHRQCNDYFVHTYTYTGFQLFLFENIYSRKNNTNYFFPTDRP